MEGYLLVKPKGYKAASGKIVDGTIYSKGDYDKQYQTNLDTQAIIDSVVGYITSTNYTDFTPVVALVEDAVDQLGFAETWRKKAEESAKSNDFQNATLQAGQWWQYQVKAADIGLRAKTYLEQNGAKVVK
jgi:nitrous-oxide reductase